jgi:hypothetical protein
MIRIKALTCLVLAAAGGIAPAAAQSGDVAYVETVTGNVTASAQGTTTALDVLDIISDRTRVELAARSELRLCLHGPRKLVALKGPLRATIGADSVSADDGKAIALSRQDCAVPMISTFQGGIVSRSVTPTSPMQVSLQPTIKIVSGAKAVRRIVLWDAEEKKKLATFERSVARPKLEEGRSYLLVVERDDSGELKMPIQASAGTKTGPLILVAPR